MRPVDRQVSRELSSALEQRSETMRYGLFTSVLYCFQLPGNDCFVGVFGDPDVGSYDWFIWNPASRLLDASDQAYGSPESALIIALGSYVKPLD